MFVRIAICFSLLQSLLACTMRIENMVLSGMPWLKRPLVTAPDSVLGHELALGAHRNRGELVDVTLSASDLQAGHLACLGRTGVGKSTFLLGLLSGIARLPNHPAIVFLDPNSDAVHDFALRCIPDNRRDDVVFLNLAEPSFPPRLPFFWAPPGVPKDVVIETTFSLFRLMFAEQWSASRMANLLFSITATMCSLPRATLLDVPRLLFDSAFRNRALAQG